MLPLPSSGFAHPSWAAVDGGLGTVSADPYAGAHITLRMLTYGLIFYVAIQAAVYAKFSKRAIQAIAVFGTCLALFGIVTRAIDNNPILGNDIEPNLVRATFLNRNHYATYAVFALLANLCAFSEMSSKYRVSQASVMTQFRDRMQILINGGWVFGLGALICMVAIIGTQSRAGMASGVVGLLAYFWLVRRKSTHWTYQLAPVAVVLAFGLTASFGGTGLFERFLMTSTENLRFQVYPNVIEGILDRPLLGHGAGAFVEVFRAYTPQSAALAEWTRAHNVYLEKAFELGLPAALAFYAALGIIAIRLYKGTRRRVINKQYSAFALSALIVAAVHSIFDFSLQIPAIAALLAFIIGIGWTESLSREMREKRREI